MSVPSAGQAGPPPANDGGAGRLSPVQGLALQAMLAAVWLLRHMPEGPAYRAASGLGLLLWLVQPARRALARDNLARVCDWLVAHDRAVPHVRAAAADRGRFEALLRDVFRHWVMTYLESAMAMRWDAGTLGRRVTLEDPEATARALAPIAPGQPGRVFVSLHFGSVELTGVYAALLGGLPVLAPMETVGGKLASAYFDHVRGAFGVSIVPAAGAAPVLQRRLAEGGSVGLVADRSVVGSGTKVELFGAPARLPASPAVLAARAEAPMFVLALRREGRGRWRARVLEVGSEPVKPAEAARELLLRQVAAFESLIGDAPEQWWTLLFPIWEDGGRRTVT